MIRQVTDTFGKIGKIELSKFSLHIGQI